MIASWSVNTGLNRFKGAVFTVALTMLNASVNMAPFFFEFDRPLARLHFCLSTRCNKSFHRESGLACKTAVTRTANTNFDKKICQETHASEEV